MPYKSKAQQAKFHVLLKEGKIKKSVVDEYDSASKGAKLPERVTFPKLPKGPKVKISSVDQLRKLAKKMK